MHPPEYVIQLLVPKVMYALALSLFALLVLSVFFPEKRRHHERKWRR